MSHTTKLWEKMIERRLKKETNISKNQFEFMSKQSKMEAVHLLKRLLEKFQEKK